jgi:hypothetical protein
MQKQNVLYYKSVTNFVLELVFFYRELLIISCVQCVPDLCTRGKAAGFWQ